MCCLGTAGQTKARLVFKIALQIPMQMIPIDRVPATQSLCFFRSIMLCAFTSIFSICEIRAEIIEIPNASFESPVTTFVDTRLDSWQKTSKPDRYD